MEERKREREREEKVRGGRREREGGRVREGETRWIKRVAEGEGGGKERERNWRK